MSDYGSCPYHTCVKKEIVDGFATDVLRLTSENDMASHHNNNFSPRHDNIASPVNCHENVLHILFFVIPGNPGTLSFYKDFISKLHHKALLIYHSPQFVVETVAAGHANHHFSDNNIDRDPASNTWVDFTAQIQHKYILLESLLNNKSKAYKKIYLVGHSIGAYVCTQLYTLCQLNERVECELLMLMPYIRHSSLPDGHRKQLELVHATDPISRWIICLLLSLVALLLPVFVKQNLVVRYVQSLPLWLCPNQIARKLFTPRMIFNHFVMGVEEIKLVKNNEKDTINTIRQANAGISSINILLMAKQPKQKQQVCTEEVRSRRLNTQDCVLVVRGLRYALPEEISTVTHFKNKFVGFTLIYALAHMWRLEKGQQSLFDAEAYWRSEVEEGRVLVSSRRKHQLDSLTPWSRVRSDQEMVIASGDKVKVLSHCHERVISQSRPALLASSPVTASYQSQYFIFDKPAGVSCCEDPDRVNTFRALASEVVGKRLHLVHRLDRLVTGCIVLASSAKAAGRARRLMQDSKTRSKNVGKYYIARVEGVLPVSLSGGEAWKGVEGVDGRLGVSVVDVGVAGGDPEALWSELDCRPEIQIESLLWFDSRANRSRVVINESYEVDSSSCNREIDGVTVKETSNVTAPQMSVTRVCWIATMPDGSHLLRCQPVTGHRHQIRCHLESIGLPIANDTLYGGARGNTDREDCDDGRVCRAFIDDEFHTLKDNLGRSSSHFREWCAKCHWTDEQLSQSRSPVYINTNDEIWLRSWRYELPELHISASAPLPPWSLLKPASCSEALYDALLREKARATDGESCTLSRGAALETSEGGASDDTRKRPSFASSVYMLYTDNDVWAPYKDYEFFRKKLMHPRGFLNSETEANFLSENNGTASLCDSNAKALKLDNVQFVPGLKHAFPLSPEQTDVVIEHVYRRLSAGLEEATWTEQD